MYSFAQDLLLSDFRNGSLFCVTSRIFCWWKKIWKTTSNIYSLGNTFVDRMSANQLFFLNFTISNQSASGIKSDPRPLSCQRTHYRNLERQKRQNRFKSSSFIMFIKSSSNTAFSMWYFLFAITIYFILSTMPLCCALHDTTSLCCVLNPLQLWCVLFPCITWLEATTIDHNLREEDNTAVHVWQEGHAGRREICMIMGWLWGWLCTGRYTSVNACALSARNRRESHVSVMW